MRKSLHTQKTEKAFRGCLHFVAYVGERNKEAKDEPRAAANEHDWLEQK